MGRRHSRREHGVRGLDALTAKLGTRPPLHRLIVRFSSGVLVWRVRSDAVLRRRGGLGPMVVGTPRTRAWCRSLFSVFDTVAAITRRAKQCWQNRKHGHFLEHPCL